ncbi:MAG TPA: sigma 54-interacting transcriptional regulator, partial [Terriglobales bacterium]|nr:sigma 54-interacting transcriptional regulator [Terriglobales bacterium]
MQRALSHEGTGEQVRNRSAELEFFPAVSPAMRVLESALDALAGVDIPVLICGENGSGKRTTALRVHQLRNLAPESFLEPACANNTPDMFSVLPWNGNGKGRGQVEGTVYLSEVGDLSNACQLQLVKWLSRAPKDGSAASHGFRVIASTRRDLQQEARDGRFREDLYFLIGGVCLRIFPLRSRREDIPLLFEWFLDRYSALFCRPKPAVGPATLKFLMEYHWPGNVRELKDAAKTLAAVGDERLALTTLGSGVEGFRWQDDSGVMALKDASRAASRQAERELITAVL